MEKEKDYWENRYRHRGSSGSGSVGRIREWKWKIIEKFLPEVNHVIDVGCGDLDFWKDRDCDDYIGIDISSTIILKNRMTKPHWEFYCRNAAFLIPRIRKPNVFCLDVLYHQMDPFNFLGILENLCEYSSDLIFVYSLVENPFGEIKTDGIYQFFRPLETYIPLIFEKSGFRLLELRKFSNSGMYVFGRENR